jgi:hypothetical protein
MNLYEQLDKKELMNLLSKGWMTHDAMWFFHSLQEHGIEKTNKVNLAAVKSMAAVEAHRIMKAAGKKNGKVETFEEFTDLMEAFFSVVKVDFMDFYWSVAEKNRVRWGYHKCWAHDGITKLGAIDGYRCGVILRVTTWFDALGVSYRMTPEDTGCLMHTKGKCEGEFRFSLK